MDSKNHCVILTDRSRMELSGISEVTGFDEKSVELSAGESTLFITGSSLNVTLLDLSQGRVDVTGKIDSLEYGDRARPVGFFKSFFRTK